MQKVVQYAMAGAAAFVILTAGLLGSARIKKWETQRQAYEDSLHVVRHDNKLLLDSNQALQITLDSTKAHVHTVIVRIHDAQAHVDSAMPVTAYPDTCAKPILARDSIIDGLNVAVDTLLYGWTAEREANARLSGRLAVSDSMLAAGKKLLDTAPIHKTFWGRLIPHPSLGVAAGVDIHGKPNAVAGVTLSW